MRGRPIASDYNNIKRILDTIEMNEISLTRNEDEAAQNDEKERAMRNWFTELEEI